jgi:hypothetical protein
MRRLVIALVLGLGLTLGVAAPAFADDPSPDFAPNVDPSLLKERHMREPEILHAKPSGFWTSNRPAVGGAYRYRMLLIGVGIASIMGTIMIVVIKRNGRRAA